MDRISAVLITKDEARNVERCLASLAPVVDEIVVVDGFSTDDTVARCERLGARVVRHAWTGFGPQKNLANGLARHEWILSIDADEALDPFLQRAIAEAKAAGLRGAYEMARLNWYFGRFVRHGLEYPDRKVRLFPRSKVVWNENLVHEGLRFQEPLPVTRLEGHLLHYTYRRVAEHVAVLLEKSLQAAEVIEVAMADDQRVELARIDAGQFDIVEQSLGRIAEVEHDVALLARALRLQEQREPPLIVQAAAIVPPPRRRLDRYAVDLAGAKEGVEAAVDEDANR